MDEVKKVMLKASEYLKQGRRICVATIIRKQGSGPRPIGSKMIYCDNGEMFGSIGGGALEYEIGKIAEAVLKEGVPRIVDFDLSGKQPEIDALCGGRVSVLLEPMGTAKRLVVFGGGHVGKAIAHLANMVGFAVTIVDNRSEIVGELDKDIRLISSTPEVLGENIELDQDSLVVICTRSHSLDESFLAAILPFKPRYIGMLGSRNKAKVILEDLGKKGLNHDLLRKVRIPVGIDIGAVTPEEIAVSIVAELIQETRKQKGESE